MCGMKVGVQGLGCMGWSAFYESAKGMTDEAAIKVFIAAVDAGVTLFNTADFYGPLTTEGYGHNLRMLAKCLPLVNRSKIQVMVKVGIDTRSGTFKHNASPAELKKTVDWCLSELKTDYIDIAVLNREDHGVGLEQSIQALADLVKSKKIRHIGMSEFSAANIRKASKVAKISCIEQEWSLVSRDLEDKILPTCRELGIAIVAYSPLARGLLTGAVTTPPQDWRATTPRFGGDNFGSNLKLVDALNKLALQKQCTTSQLGLAWLHAQGDDVIPIPGTSKLDHLMNNINSTFINLTQDDLEAIQQACPTSAVKGDRYAVMAGTYHGNADQ